MRKERAEQNRQVIERFIAACQADERVVAAFLGGSYAGGTPDDYSDLDLYVILADESFESFYAERGTFVRLMGEPVFLEVFGDYHSHPLYFILANGVEAELGIGTESDFQQLHSGPYRPLLDKRGILDGLRFPVVAPDPAVQLEYLRAQLNWFWHDLSHFIAAIARGQLWAAAGSLEEVRGDCITLTHLHQHFNVSSAGYEKLEKYLDVAQLAPLAATFVPLEREAMLRAVLIIVAYYQEIASQLCAAHDLAYPSGLEQVFYPRLKALLA